MAMSVVERIEDAYVKLLAMSMSEWKGRYIRDGQDILCDLRGALSALTGEDFLTVQDNAEQKAFRKEFPDCPPWCCIAFREPDGTVTYLKP